MVSKANKVLSIPLILHEKTVFFKASFKLFCDHTSGKLDTSVTEDGMRKNQYTFPFICDSILLALIL